MFFIQIQWIMKPHMKIWVIQYHKVKVKESRNRPGVAQRAPRGLDSQSSWHSAHEAGEFVGLTQWPPLTPGSALSTHFY